MGESTVIKCLFKFFCKSVVEIFGNRYLSRPMLMMFNVFFKCMMRGTASLACWVALIVCTGNGKFNQLLGKVNLQGDMGHQQSCLKRSRFMTCGYDMHSLGSPVNATFVKAFPCPEDPNRKLFKERQESARKDVERAFWVLQNRWTIVRGPARYWYRKKLKQILLACIILHNMIVEDEEGHVKNWYNDEDDEPAQPIHGSNRGFQDYLRTNSELRDPQVHHQLRSDLVEHIWGQYNNNP
ncbi:uncharacterized protein [Primulina eburnea]|uniref:uncharacterized protein n=1 Tax=Primulina eburnea TaxID=1245227 RepID=UPI003C6C27AE